jgi:hypothetical protein
VDESGMTRSYMGRTLDDKMSVMHGTLFTIHPVTVTSNK